jgi:hypothetical protein
LVQFGAAVSTSTTTITMEDFDIIDGGGHSGPKGPAAPPGPVAPPGPTAPGGSSEGFLPNKVEPGLLILGSGNSVLANATPDEILAAMVQTSTSNDGTYSLNVGTLLSDMHINDSSMSGYVLFADDTNGETVPSDPFEMKSVSAPVGATPEPVSLAALGFGVMAMVRKRRSK